MFSRQEQPRCWSSSDFFSRREPGVTALAVLVFIAPFASGQPSPQQTIDTSFVANCAPASGQRPWMDTNRSPECRAKLALAAMTPEERLSFRGTNERLGLSYPVGTGGPNGIGGGGNRRVEQTPVTSGRSANVTAFPSVITLGATWDRDLARRFGEALGEDPFHISELVVPEILGVHSRKVGTLVKHFAGNNQENTRTGVFSDYAG